MWTCIGQTRKLCAVSMRSSCCLTFPEREKRSRFFAAANKSRIASGAEATHVRLQLVHRWLTFALNEKGDGCAGAKPESGVQSS